MDASAAIEGLDRTEAKLNEYASERGLVVRPELIWPGMPLPREQQGPIRHACWSVAGKLPGGVPAKDRRPREDVGGFESTQLDRRYIVEVAKGQDHAWLRQLFPPSFIDWLASNTPVDFGFRLDDGVFTCECPQYRGQHRADGEVDEEHLDLLADAGGRAGSRIRDEVLEEADALEGGTRPDSGAAHTARAKQPLGGRLVRMLTKFAEGVDSRVKDFAEKRGMEPKDAAEFHANHIRLPFPGPADDVLAGPLPGTKRHGELAWMKFSSLVDMEKNYVAVVLDTGRELPSARLDAEDATIPGFGEGLSEQALQLARAGSFGVSTDGTKACVYFKSNSPGNWPSGVEVEAFVPRAVELIDSL